VANAFSTATDAVMLSARDLRWATIPVEAVKTLARIIDEIEGSEYYTSIGRNGLT